MSTKAKKTKPGDVRSMAYDVAEKIKDLPLSKLTNPVDRSLVAVEIFHDNQRVASHIKNTTLGGKTTVISHMPKSHQQHLKWTPSKIVTWAQQVGEATYDVIQGLINSDRHAEQTYRSCLGIKRLSTYYPAERIEAACRRAIAINGRSYKSIQSILKNGLDQQSLPLVQEEKAVKHKNLRGNAYYALDDQPIHSGEYPC